jgi:hypothetical protein
MELAQPVDWIKKPCVGYMMNAEFSDENAAQLEKLMDDLAREFGDGVFCMPRTSLHITLLDWIAPLIDYEDKDKDVLYKKIRSQYDKAMADILNTVGPITVTFNEIEVFPNTVIILGQDDGTFRYIREQFLERVELLPGTKLPPQIIHSSLARFTKPLELDKVRAFLAGKIVDITQEMTTFRLVRSAREPLLEFETLKRYKLSKAS